MNGDVFATKFEEHIRHSQLPETSQNIPKNDFPARFLRRYTKIQILIYTKHTKVQLRKHGVQPVDAKKQLYQDVEVFIHRSLFFFRSELESDRIS